MNLRGPVLTLLAVLTLAVVLLLVNMGTATETATQVTIPPATTQAPVTTQAQAPATTQPPADEQPPADAPESAPPAAADQTAYAGRTSGNEATIAIVVQGDQVAAYICDGKQVEAWLEGTITDGELNLQGNDDASATGVVSDGAVFGTVQVQGKQWPYAAQRAESPAGLYEGNGASARVGWIVLQDGSQTGIAKVGGTTRPAPALDPNQLTGVEVDGSTIIPRPVTGIDPVVGPPA